MVGRILQRDWGARGGPRGSRSPRHSPLHGLDAGIHGVSPGREIAAVEQGLGGRCQEQPVELPGHQPCHCPLWQHSQGPTG